MTVHERLARIEGLPIIVVFLSLVGCFIVASPEVFLQLPIYYSFLTTVPPVLVLTFVIAAGEIAQSAEHQSLIPRGRLKPLILPLQQLRDSRNARLQLQKVLIELGCTRRVKRTQ